jgi:hypothetical protein
MSAYFLTSLRSHLDDHAEFLAGVVCFSAMNSWLAIDQR